jgi:hypothetical protein
MVRCPARVGLLVQVLALAVCAVSSDDTSGKTNVVKVRTPGDGYATGRKIYVGVGCEVAILDGDAGISGDMAKSLLYTTGILPPSPFAPAPSSCVPGNEVNGIGISMDAEFALASHGSSLSVVRLNGGDDDIAARGLRAGGKRGGKAKTALASWEFGSPGRVSDSVQDSDRQSEVFFVSSNDGADGYIVAVRVYSTGDLRGHVEVVSGKKLPDNIVLDARPQNSSVLIASTKNGIEQFFWNGTALIPGKRVQTPPDGDNGSNDGITLSNNMVYIAAQGNGLRVVDMAGNDGRGEFLGTGKGNGWMGGVTRVDDFAIVAADPGVHVFEVASDPSKPKLVSTCRIGDQDTDSYKGWNLDMDHTNNQLFLADYKGGLAVLHVSVTGSSKQKSLETKVIGHFGAGVMKGCT